MTTALITGASAGIGAAFAEELASRQYNLVLVARSEDKLQQLAQQLREQYQVQVSLIVQDLTVAGAGTAVFEAVTHQGLTIDLLINNAGFGEYGAFADIEAELQLKMIQLNVLALVDLTRRFLPAMRDRRSGGIINMASVAAFQPMPYFSIYAATKAFVLSFSEAIAAENRDYGIQILAVCPGPTETGFFEEAEFPPLLVDAVARTYTPVKTVVHDALKALDHHQSTVIPGNPSNHLLVNLPRFLPREAVVGLWKTLLGISRQKQ